MKINRVYPDFSYADEKIEQKNTTTASSSFGKYLKDAVDAANDAQIKADEETTKLITGESTDIHQVLLAASEARIQMELVMEVRNKLLDSYQEISKMQI